MTGDYTLGVVSLLGREYVGNLKKKKKQREIEIITGYCRLSAMVEYEVWDCGGCFGNVGK